MMQTQFTPQELQTILTLINRVQIQGNEAMTVAILQQKLANLLQVKTEEPVETTP